LRERRRGYSSRSAKEGRKGCRNRIMAASGMGFRGVSRCLVFWRDYSSCMKEADVPYECQDFAEDYLECIHNTKYAARQMAIHQRREQLRKEGRLEQVLKGE